MKYVFCLITLFFFSITSCRTGNLVVVADINSDIKEASGIEMVPNSPLFWVIEDAGNANKIYGLNEKGNIEKEINIENADNEDWEELTSDAQGNMYIGDFGNNSKKRERYAILKIPNINSLLDKAQASYINFTLPKSMKSKDFESFFLYNDNFYIFSKENKKAVLISVPNSPGDHVAIYLTQFDLAGKKNEITAADISDDGKTVVLLNHDKLWRLTGFKTDNFFEGVIESFDFKHDSQKEGICFKNQSTVYINDESNKSEGGNIYSFKF